MTGDALTPQEAFAAIAMTTMVADGHVEPDEDDVMLDALLALPEYDGMDERAARAILVRVEARARRDGDATLVDAACAAIPSARRAAAYALAREIAAADGEADEGEHLARLRKQLGL